MVRLPSYAHLHTYMTKWWLTSLQTSMVPNMTWRPSKKLSPMMMTVAPPVVQPSLGLMALMLGVAGKIRHNRLGANYPNDSSERSLPLAPCTGHSSFHLCLLHTRRRTQITSRLSPRGRGRTWNTNQSDYTHPVIKHHPCPVCEDSDGALVFWHVAKRAGV